MLCSTAFRASAQRLLPSAERLGVRVLALLACLSLVAPIGVTAQPFRVLDIQNRNGAVTVHHESALPYYYQLQRVNLKTGTQNILDIARGAAAVGQLADRTPPNGSSYYRVTRVPNNEALDSDGDGIDDVYELGHPPLNPLNPKDAGQLAPSGRTYLDDYVRDESNLFLYPFLVGRGMHDVTGPSADGGMMGYAEGSQKSAGIHDRQWARAFVAADRNTPDKRVVFVVVETGQIFNSITQGVNERLQADDELKKFYSFKNIVLSATHTHGGAGGHSHHVLYNMTIGGFSWQTYDAMVHGIYMAIKKAHRDLAPGKIIMNQGQLTNANENREPGGFLSNVEHSNPALGNPFGKDNRDTEMLSLRFEHSNKQEMGVFNWFPVHGVSYSKENHLLTSDNKGYAAYLFEQSKGTHYPGHGRAAESSGFVAGFANSNPGDMTANRRTLEPGGWPENGKDDAKRAALIGSRQFEKASQLYKGQAGAPSRLFGQVDYRHMYLAMTNVVVNPPKLYPYNIPEVGFPGSSEKPPWSTFIGALGIDFTRGTLDGEAMPQILIDTFRVANGIIPDPATDEFERRHLPKEVVLTTGTLALDGMTWTPQILPISILRIGKLAILAVPGEFTSIAGWRLRKTVESILGPDTHAIIAGLANDYSGYITTYEEYTHQTRSDLGIPFQSYEAASTQFGAFTLAAYQTKFIEMAQAMVDGKEVPSAKFPTSYPPLTGLLNASDPILDLPPLPQARPAEYKGQAGCPAGQFWDVLTGYCWSCPAGYDRTIFSVEGNSACASPATSIFSAATKYAQGGCAQGQFYDLLTAACWSCPNGYNRTIFPVNGTEACEKPATTDYAFATKFNQGSCGPGQFYDLVTAACWSCPVGYNRTIFPVNGTQACENPANSDYAFATKFNEAGCGPGQFYDIGTAACWSCPAGYNRTIFPVNGASACELPAHSEFEAANRTGGTGFFGTDCPSGYVYDFGIRACFRCPSGTAKLIFKAWNDSGACERVIPAVSSSATRFNGLCPNGQFLDIGTGYCWSCPSGFNRTIFPITFGSACERVNPAVFTSASRFPGLCPPGQFLDIGTGYCWSCPAGFNRTIFPITFGSACDRFNPAIFTGASRFAGLCPAGQFLDIGNGYCWSCPAGYDRTIFPVDQTAACEKFFPEKQAPALRHGKYFCEDRGAGWFLDITRNECWTCNGWLRNLNPVTDPQACTGPLALFGDLVLDAPWLRPEADRVYQRGQRIAVSFWGGHPKNVFGTVNNRMVDALPTFLEIQRWTGSKWETIKTDADWDTAFHWERVGIAASKITITWDIGPEALSGTYRVIHTGFSLDAAAKVSSYQGISPQFTIPN